MIIKSGILVLAFVILQVRFVYGDYNQNITEFCKDRVAYLDERYNDIIDSYLSIRDEITLEIFPEYQELQSHRVQLLQKLRSLRSKWRREDSRLMRTQEFFSLTPEDPSEKWILLGEEIDQHKNEERDTRRDLVSLKKRYSTIFQKYKNYENEMANVRTEIFDIKFPKGIRNCELQNLKQEKIRTQKINTLVDRINKFKNKVEESRKEIIEIDKILSGLRY